MNKIKDNVDFKFISEEPKKSKTNDPLSKLILMILFPNVEWNYLQENGFLSIFKSGKRISSTKISICTDTIKETLKNSCIVQRDNITVL